MNSQSLVALLGDPTDKNFQHNYLVMAEVPTDIASAIPCLAGKKYMNSLMVEPLWTALRALIAKDLHKEIKTFDGIYSVRLQRGSSTQYSYHSFGLAIDLNASHNARGFSVEQLKEKHLTPFSDAFVQTFVSHGFMSGASFRVTDRMHFQLADRLIHKL